ncbi:helix-turn-helix domain-containing protein [Agromyces bauzanensis]
MDAPRDIGTRIREARKVAGLTQEQLAELAGTSTRTVRDIEKGTGATGLGIVARVAEVVGLRLAVHR